MADEPMTDERLQQIRRYAEALHSQRHRIEAVSSELVTAGDDLAALLAEVERLRAREAAAMAIVQAVADDPGVYIFEEDDGYYAPCPWCHARSAEQHTHDCPVTKARALIAQE